MTGVSAPDRIAMLEAQHAADVALLEAASAERDKALAELKETKGWLDLSNDAHATVRQLLDAQGVPSAPFIDDNVGNAIFQRNEARARVRELETKAAANWTQTVKLLRDLDAAAVELHQVCDQLLAAAEAELAASPVENTGGPAS